MTKRSFTRFLFTFICAAFALACVLTPGPAKADSVTYISHSLNVTAVNSTETTRNDVTVFPKSKEIAPGWYYVNRNITIDGRVSLQGDTQIILGDGYTLDVKGLYIPQGYTLTIYGQSAGTGKLYSHPSGGAAIGAYGNNHPGGTIIIHGGTIEAIGASHCAGIGSNDGNGTTAPITIYGGTVTAKGGSDGAAIGGGRNCSGGTITIYGGNITANGPTDSDTSENGAGIGGGDCGNGGSITIHGGTITTYSRDGAGIGGGDDGDGGTITINGGTITSTKVNQGQGARIGGGCDGAPGTIAINGGTVTTVGGKGAGIGGGRKNKSGGSVTIDGGVISASGSYGIGSGESGSDVAVTLGYKDSTQNSISINGSSYNGTVTLQNDFQNANGKYLAGLTPDKSKLAGSALVYWDSMSWADLQAMIDSAADGDVITLENDVTAKAGDNVIRITKDQSITLDLNGYTLNRNAKAFGVESHVIRLEGSLIITDSSSGETGRITGSYMGSGVANYGGTLTLNKGIISDNENPGYGGAGVEVAYSLYTPRTYGTFTMNGGSIQDNTADNGAGVRVHEGCTFTLNDGTIQDNRAENSMGGGVLTMGEFNMNGGMIKNNFAAGDNLENGLGLPGGGGVAVFYDDAVFRMSGGSITGNSSTGYGGGVQNWDGLIVISGGSITNNTTYSACGAGIDNASGTIRMTGGEISSNTALATESQVQASVFGGGIFLRSYTDLEMSGNPKVKNNTVGIIGTAGTMNVDVLITGYAYMTVIGPFTEGADISIYPGIMGMEVTRGLHENGGTGDPLHYLKADPGRPSKQLAIAINANGEAVVGPRAVITYKANGGSGDDIPVNVIKDMDGYVLAENTFTPPAGKVFYNWEISGKAYWPGDPYTPSNDTEVKAVWGSENCYTVSFDKNNDLAEGSMYPMKVEKSSDTVSFTLPECRFSMPEEYMFLGWMIGDDTMTDHRAGETITLTGNVTLKAHWAELPYAVVFMDNMGFVNIETVICTANEVYTLPDPGSEGSELRYFGGWIVDDGEKLYFPGDTVMVDRRIIVRPLWGSEWSGLQYTLATAADNATVKLEKDYMATSADRALQIPAGKNLTLDLNGHTLDRHGITIKDPAIRVRGTLVIKDSSSAQNGKITGGTQSGIVVGYAEGETYYSGSLTLEGGSITCNVSSLSSMGGGVSVTCGTLTITGGSISDNVATGANGGGVYVTRGSLTMSDGKISGNQTAKNGGGIALISGSGYTNTISGGEISGNVITAGTGYGTGSGGGIYLSFNTVLNLSGGTIRDNSVTGGANEGGGISTMSGVALNMTGGTITGNTADNGGGISLNGNSYMPAVLTMSGGTISGNTCREDFAGGGINQNNSCEIKISGAPVITGNAANSGKTDNITLHDKCISITGPLSADALMGVTVHDQSTVLIPDTNGAIVFTTGLSGNGGTANFSSDSGAFTVSQNGDGEAILIPSDIVAAPIFNPASGIYDEEQIVTIFCDTPGATIYYTIDGSDPTADSPEYIDAIPVAGTSTLKAFAVKEGMTSSAIAEATYTIIIPETVATPAFSPEPGTYTEAQSVEIICETEGAVIHYTTDGTDPTTDSTAYSGPIHVDATTTIKAIAVANEMANSEITQATYTMKTATPVFSPEPGTYGGEQNVTITCATEGATIYYTTELFTDPLTDGIEYTGAIPVTASTTIKAAAVKDGIEPSDTALGTYSLNTVYMLDVTAPEFSPVRIGYAQPAAQPLTIVSSSNTLTTISSVTLSGEGETAFVLNKTDGTTIAAGATDNTTYTVRPAAGLAVGTYTVTVTVAYNNDETAQAEVSFTVENLEPCEVVISVQKTLSGREWMTEDGFEFTLAPVGEAPAPETRTETVTIDSVNHTETFEPITITAPGTYSWTVSETHKGETLDGVQYASEDRTVTVIVKNDGTGILVADEGSSLTPAVSFTNTFVGYSVTFRVVNGSWDDGTATDKTITVGYNQLIPVDDIPDVGDSPDEGYMTNGSWDIEPPLETPVTRDVTYTYTYYPPFGDATFTLPSGARTIEANAFEGDTLITVVDASNCTTIGDYAFSGCTGLTKIRLPINCTIGGHAFDGCTALYAIYGPTGGTTQDWAEDHDILFIGE